MEGNFHHFESSPQPESPAENFSKRLEAVSSGSVSVENIDTYTQETLDSLVSLSHDVTAAYTQETSDPQQGDALEDAAFTHYSLPVIGNLLQTAQDKAVAIEAAQKYIATQIRYTESVIVPPDELNSGVIHGEGEFSEKQLLPRLKTLLYTLETDFNIPLDGVSVTEGAVKDEMMRKAPYYRIEIPDLRRIVYICDEEGNTSYVFDADLLEQAGVEVGALDDATKDDRNALILEVPGIGYRLNQSLGWRQNISDLLSDPIPVPMTREEVLRAEVKQPLDVPYVSDSELDPWKGCWEDGEGKHWASISQLAPRLGVSKKTLGDVIDITTQPLSTKKVRTRYNGRTWDVYCFEELSAIESFSHLQAKDVRRIEKSGEWAGFWTDPAGKHWSSIHILSDKIGISPDALEGDIQRAELKSVKIINRNLDEVDAYCYEEAISLPDLAARQESPRTASSGPWQGFWEDAQGRHWGPDGPIADKLGLNPVTVSKLTDAYLTKHPVRDSGNHILDGYCYEDAEMLPQVVQLKEAHPIETSGEWAGFWTDPGGRHWGPVGKIADRLGLQWMTVNRRLTADLEIKSVRDISTGPRRDAYCWEEVSQLDSIQQAQRSYAERKNS